MNPYSKLPDHNFWRRAISRVAPTDVDPVVSAPLRIGSHHQVATAGSCFAQHIARRLPDRGIGYLVAETEPATPGACDENYGVFSARFGNIYTTLQLLQLFDRAYGLFEPTEGVWRRGDGAFVDPFRPQIQKAGFLAESGLVADRVAHLAAVRRMFETCNVFIFTLGLTEGWVSRSDRAAVPLAPGVVDGCGVLNDYRFENLEVADMADQLNRFLFKFRTVNPDAWTILTVSPVPLIATYEDRHVLVSTTYSKAALRVVADIVCRANPQVTYFPSYEIIVGAHARYAYFGEDLREVLPVGVDHVMSLFFRHYVDAGMPPEPPLSSSAAARPNGDSSSAAARPTEASFMREIGGVICDEEALDTVQ
jgi:hypothetical protein